MVGTINAPSDQRDKAVSLFTYLKELSELRTKAVRTLDQYDKVIWLADVPQEPGFHCAAWFRNPETDNEIWIEARKPHPRSAPPDPPDELKPWLDPVQVIDSSLEMPELRTRIPVTPAPKESPGEDDRNQDEETEDLAYEETYESLDEHPEIPELWEQYVQQDWWPWAEEDRRLHAAQSVYTDLFSIYQRQQRLGEQFEVVIGLGLLSWRTPEGQRVQRHLVTGQASLAFDPMRGIITVGPAADGASLTLEQDMLEAQERPDPAEQRTIETQLADLGDDIWDQIKLAALFQSWVHAVSSRGSYAETLERDPTLGDDPRVRLAPTLILRKRTERNLIHVFDVIIDQLKQGSDIPVGVQRLIDIVDDFDVGHAGEIRSESSGPTDGDGDIYFPLPANEEQLEIVERLQTRQGILVQGPPGTGKSHTIANLVCHLLATGQRVLVTSHTARALRVLHDKIPAEVSSLCVSLLGNDRAALQELENAVHGITSEYDQWDSRQHQGKIDHLEKKLDEARRREAKLHAELRSLHEHESYRHSLAFGGYEGTAATIAQRVGEEAPRLSWIADRPSAETVCPLDRVEATELLGLLRTLTAEREAAACQTIPSPADLPTTARFVELHRAETSARAAVDATAEGQAHPAFPALAKATREQRQELRTGLDDLQRRFEVINRRSEPWARSAASDVVAGQDRKWRQLRDVTRENLAPIEERARTAEAHRLTGVEERDRAVVKSHATALLQHFESGGGKGFGPFRAPAVKDGSYLLESIRVDGRVCDNPTVLRQLLDWIEVNDRLDTLRRYWKPYDKPAPGPFSAQVVSYHDLNEAVDEAVQLGDDVARLQRLFVAIPGAVEPAWAEEGERAALIKAVEAANAAAKLREAEAPLRDLELVVSQAGIGHHPHPIVLTLLDAVRERDAHRYTEGYDIIRGIEADRLAIVRRDVLLDRLRPAAPHLTVSLIRSPANPSWDDRLGRWEAAWDWARASTWLERREDPGLEHRLRRDLDMARDQIHAAIQQLAAAKAWKYFFHRMTEEQRRHLMAWTRAMKKIGKGTGKHAAEHRRAARENMDGCRAAIPAWIMPLYRVAESVRPGTDAFDVVIIDEASQSGPEAILLEYLAKKIIVVGDDKQISPDHIGMNREEVNVLRRRHVAQLPHNHVLGFDDSFFDQATVRYGGRIRLREHFRCMPEIIQFSNNLCYQSDPLIPLRQYGVERLEPVKLTHVRDGYRQGTGAKVTNPPEADAVVDTIVRCCNDPAYAGKSMGVISLQGDSQAKQIEAKLLIELGPEEMERREIVCGDAYAFQGDQRDVMFLSLVAAVDQEHRIGALTNEKAQQRFNVAASRARDQLWLFHTATLSDLNPNCMRHKLLKYCLDPRVEPTTFDGVDPDADELIPPFESLFEQRVFCKIRERAYRVLPQVPVAEYRIDLVVEGMKGRMAVECDGDAWHGPEQYDADMARQRQLERCGWTFWRVRGSTFFRDPEKAMEELWRVLDKLDIHPAAESERPSHDSDLPPAPPVEDIAISVVPADPEMIRQLETTPRREQSRTIEEPTAAYDRTASPPRELASISRFAIFFPWQPHLLPDPRTASLDEIMAGLVEIVAAEGPMPCHRAYRLYAQAAGVDERESNIRSTFNRAMFQAIQRKRLAERDEHGIPGQLEKIVRVAGSRLVVVRERGDRLLNEIPPSEIAAGMRSLLPRNQTDSFVDPEPLFGRLLQSYGLDRVPGSDWQDRILRSAIPFLRSDHEDSAQIGLPIDV